jgi:hypothetical protein
MVGVALAALGCGGSTGEDPDGTNPDEVPSSTCVGESAPAALRVSLHAQSVLSAGPIAGAEVLLCRLLDVDCESPEIAPIVTDANGDAALELAPGFNGYAQVRLVDLALPPEQQLVPSRYYFNPVNRQDQSIRVSMATVGVRNALASSVGVAQRDDRGMMLVEARSCESAAVEGVIFGSDVDDTSITTFYVLEGVPSTSALATDASGYGGLVNVPPGAHTITASFAETGRLFNSQAVAVVPGVLTQTQLFGPVP